MQVLHIGNRRLVISETALAEVLIRLRILNHEETKTKKHEALTKLKAFVLQILI